MNRVLISILWVLYPLTVHILILQDQPRIAVILLVFAALLIGALRLKGEGQIWSLGWHWISLAVAAMGVISLFRDDMYALYLPPIIYNSIFAAIFGLTLTPNSNPLIEGIMQRVNKDVSVELKHYAMRLTWVWFLFFIAMGITAMLLAIFASPKAWSLFANIVNYLLVVALFLGQFIYAFVRYPHQLPRRPWKLLVNSIGSLCRKNQAFRRGSEY